ncbi:MAG: hypothetical protein ABW086_01130 [Sedimenticola sp.]
MQREDGVGIILLEWLEMMDKTLQDFLMTMPALISWVNGAGGLSRSALPGIPLLNRWDWLI